MIVQSCVDYWELIVVTHQEMSGESQEHLIVSAMWIDQSKNAGAFYANFLNM